MPESPVLKGRALFWSEVMYLTKHQPFTFVCVVNIIREEGGRGGRNSPQYVHTATPPGCGVGHTPAPGGPSGPRGGHGGAAQ